MARMFMVYSLVSGALEDERFFPDTDGAGADEYARQLVDELKADCQCPWEVWFGVCYECDDSIEGSQWAGEEPALISSGGGQ